MLLALCIGVAGTVVVNNWGSDPLPAAPITSAAPTVAPSGQATTPAAAPVVAEVPTVAPPTEWTRFEGVWLPYSETAGPTAVVGPVAQGFQRSPVGAMLAATHIAIRMIVTPGEGWETVVLEQVEPGPGRVELLRQAQGVPNEPPADGYAQVVGFRYVAYSPDLAVVQLVFQQTDGTLVVNTLSVVWSGGEWLLRLNSNGAPSPTMLAVGSLAGYVPWGGG